MITIEMPELQSTLRQLDQGIYHHEQWAKDLTRTIVCGLPYDSRDVADDAYQQCRFGQWYYASSPEALRSHPAFVAIALEHRRVHMLAARLLLESTQQSSGSPKDYDGFTNAVDRMHLELYSLKKELEELVYNRDALTGAENRTGMLIRLREQRELVKRGVHECGIVMMDVDHFKAINDTYGHSVGDKVLVAWVKHIKRHMRPYDRVYRYGGEEFLLSFPSTDLQTVSSIVERLHSGSSALDIGTDEATPITISASFGITMIDPVVSVEESIDRADIALFEAKNAGRNRSCVWNSTMTSIGDGGDASLRRDDRKDRGEGPDREQGH